MHVNFWSNSLGLIGFFPAYILQREISDDDVVLHASTVDLPSDMKASLGDLPTLT